MNIFMYGADEKRRGVSCPSARVFPKLFSWNRLGRKYVSFKECSFAVKKGRESTARVVVVRGEKKKKGRRRWKYTAKKKNALQMCTEERSGTP